MKFNKNDILAVFAVFSIPILNVFYQVLNGHNREVHTLITKFDAAVPFIDYFIVPYSLWYPFIISSLIYLCFRARERYFKTIIAIDIGLICCYIAYIVFQTTVPRPELVGDSIFIKLVRITYALDEPYNCFPSIHVLTSYLVMKGFYKGNIKNTIYKTFVYIMGSTIIVSTLFVKQHVVADIFGAILLVEIIDYVLSYINKRSGLLWTKKPYSLLMTKKKLEI
jgi:membrane-associated phospholipid phosphatase